MDVNPEEVIQHLAEEVTRLNIQVAILKAALSKKDQDGDKEN